MPVTHRSARRWLEPDVTSSTKDRGADRPRWPAICALLLLAPVAARAEDLTVADAIRRAWSRNEGLAAAALGAKSARERAGAASAARFPTLALSARGVGTDEPMMAFGLKLDEARIGTADFDPARLNSPSLIGGVGLGATLTQPLYAGGRLSAAADAAAAQADAEASTLERRREEVALSVTEAYFGSEVAAQGVTFADDTLAHARETERFLRERSAQGLVLESEVARATSFRAQAEAQRVAALQRLASARSALALFAGEEARSARLVTPVELAPAPPEPGAAKDAGVAGRPDVRALQAQAEAARSAVKVARGSLLPELFLQASAETMRSAWDQGANWVTGVIGARWQLGLADLRAKHAAESRADAADAAMRWQKRQAAREVEEARRAIEASDARVRSAEEAVSASESARALRVARHRQGLLPLTDVLDAEAGLAGARALLLQARLEARVARAQLSLAQGEPIEGTKP